MILFLKLQVVVVFLLFYIKRVFKLYRIENKDLKRKIKKYKEKDRLLALRVEELEREIENTSVDQSSTNIIEFFENRKKIFIKRENIEIAERADRKIHIITENGTYNINTSITKLEEELGASFIKINQGTLVNTDYIEKVCGNSIQLKNGEKYYSSRAMQKRIQELFKKSKL